MERFIVLVVLFVFLFFVSTFFIECTHVDQNQIGFAYNVSDGKPVNEQNNPLLSYGYHVKVGYDATFFIINSELNSYNLTSSKDKNSPYDESLSWDSVEGVTMAVNFTIIGRVTDPWKFYANYGKTQWSYSDVKEIQDVRIYEALRHAGHYVDVKMSELAQAVGADEIRKKPSYYSKQLTNLAAKYASEFGFTITDVIFPDRYIFPGGNTITQARNMLRDANSTLEEKKKAVKTAAGLRNETIANTKIEANKIISQGKMIANELLTEANALAKQLKTSIDQIGIKGALELKMAELQGILMKQGVIQQAILTNKSIFAKPFYK